MNPTSTDPELPTCMSSLLDFHSYLVYIPCISEDGDEALVFGKDAACIQSSVLLEEHPHITAGYMHEQDSPPHGTRLHPLT